MSDSNKELTPEQLEKIAGGRAHPSTSSTTATSSSTYKPPVTYKPQPSSTTWQTSSSTS